VRICGAAIVVILIVVAATPALAGIGGSPRGASAARKAPPRKTAARKHSRGPTHYQSPFRRLVWHDEFNGPAGALPNPAKWQLVTGGNGWGNRELQYYTASPSNVFLDGAGHLAITARNEVYSDGQYTDNYTSGMVVTDGRFQVMYGRIEARIKLPAGAGLWPAFWIVGADSAQVPWPGGGELDVMETSGNDLHRNHAFLHGPASYNQYGYNLEAIGHSKQSLAAGFHLFAVDWSPGKLVMTLDGKPYGTWTARGLPQGATWVYNKPYYLVLNLAVGGAFPGPVRPSTRFPATMLVDWVRVYSH
jgi:beta-glucanase (GH16 family)